LCQWKKKERPQCVNCQSDKWAKGEKELSIRAFRRSSPAFEHVSIVVAMQSIVQGSQKDEGRNKQQQMNKTTKECFQLRLILQFFISLLLGRVLFVEWLSASPQVVFPSRLAPCFCLPFSPHLITFNGQFKLLAPTS
jgi:hypothetical protein